MAWNDILTTKPEKDGLYACFVDRKYKTFDHRYVGVEHHYWRGEKGVFETSDAMFRSWVPVENVVAWQEMPEAPEGYRKTDNGYEVDE